MTTLRVNQNVEVAQLFDLLICFSFLISLYICMRFV